MGMSMKKIKLCGLTRTEDIIAVNELKPDYIGFVFYPKSTRNLTMEQAKALKDLLDSDIKAVGVFVDADKDFIVELLEKQIIDIPQLHGREDESYIAELRGMMQRKELHNIPVFKAFKITSEEDILRAEASSADLVLLDSGKGTGMTFNWQLVKNIKRDFLLAGGLDSENVSAAIEILDPFGLDISSGIETDGRKDPVKMKAFMENVRSFR